MSISVLLDTHALLWFIRDADLLSVRAKSVLEDLETKVYLSQASVWELAIKSSLGKLKLDGGFQSFLENQLIQEAYHWIHPRLDHYVRVSELPHVHRDPFDRLLVAQALTHELPIVTNDPHIPNYPGVKTIW